MFVLQSLLILTGREEAIKVSKKHSVNGNPTVPPFPEQIQQAMFGKNGKTKYEPAREIMVLIA